VDIEPGSREQFCMGRGSALRATPTPGAAADCETRLERKLFSYALCACENMQLQGDSFFIDSFDSSRGAYAAGQTGAAVGVNGSLVQLANDTQILGSLFAAGTGVLAISGSGFLVAGDLETNTALQASQAGTRIARDVWIAGDAYQAKGHTGIADVNVTGSVHNTSAFVVAPPCACDDASLLDIPALVAQARDSNDNALVGWSPDALSYGAWIADSKSIPCGRLFVNAISLQTAARSPSIHWGARRSSWLGT
jgi:hypothetical protein